MGTAGRLAAYGLVLVLAFVGAWALGSAAGPAAAPGASVRQGDTHADGHGQDGHGEHEHGGAPASDGLAATAAGYTFVPVTTELTPREPGEYAFTITGSDGAPVTAYDVEHEQRMHLVVIRRDAAGFFHLHPQLGDDGVWRTTLTLPAAGIYRVYADFVPTGGPPLTLGTDLFAPGGFTPVPLPPMRVWEVDGYQIRLYGDLVAGSPSQVFATISRDSAPVTDLEPYLGAFGHLVALRRSDLAYLHVHPDGAPPAPADRGGPAVAFTVEVPTPGTYRLFLDFRHGDVVRTAEFTVPTRETG